MAPWTTTSATTCLRLIFTACHPVLSTEARVALTLRLLGGLTTDEIARAFLVPEPTIAQRIVRAKRTLAKANVPFEVPRGAERQERLASVLDVIYLVFNEGYSATAGEDWVRPSLCDEALRLGRARGGAGGRGARGARPGGADGAAIVAPPGACWARTANRCGCWIRIARAGIGCSIGRGLTALRRAESLTAGAGPLSASGGHRRLPCARDRAGGDRLGAHRRSLRHARRRHRVAHRPAESRGGGGHGRRAGSGPGPGGRAAGGGRAGRLSLRAERARGPAREAREDMPRRAPSSSGPPR